MIAEDTAQNKKDFIFLRKQFKNNQKNHMLRLFTVNFSLKKMEIKYIIVSGLCSSSL